MRVKVRPSAPWIIWSTILLAGCVSLTTDHLPKNAPRGYAEFYQSSDSSANLATLRVTVLQLVSGKFVDMGDVGVWTKGTRRKVACVPGTHTFALKLAAYEKHVDVEVREGYVTPVEIQLRNITGEEFARMTPEQRLDVPRIEALRVLGGALPTLIVFSMDVSPREAIPLN